MIIRIYEEREGGRWKVKWLMICRLNIFCLSEVKIRMLEQIKGLLVHGYQKLSHTPSKLQSLRNSTRNLEYNLIACLTNFLASTKSLTRLCVGVFGHFNYRKERYGLVI